jgi:TatD DNase family protein
VVDTHCHLDSCKADDAEVVAAAAAVGVRHMATVGMNDESIERALAAARTHHEVVAIVGRHPHYTEGWKTADIEPIERAAADPLARAIGETGLDYFRDRSPREDQQGAFEAQIDLAARTGLPLVIHTREAEHDTFDILRERAYELIVILHCFSAPDRLDECVDRGYFCSFAGNVTYPNAAGLRAAARDLPDELLLVETDSPYLAPQQLRGKPNEPANVVATAEFIAGLRNVPYAELDAIVERNSARVFGW